MKYSFLQETSQKKIYKALFSNLKNSNKPKLKSLKQGLKLSKKQAKRDWELTKDFIKDHPIKGTSLTGTAIATLPIPIPGAAILGVIPFSKALKKYAKQTGKML